ncbi:PREDICTED: B3 domain-containing protein Os11g0197600-like [Fragaria vesca subsp. vesca]|uniref:B3 domain-containing protein Os11g0197600-like n=1 Tax=Fragaria vesca subsp. vesca TaxID=101020 RepID=UPI0002C35489|nr:PREDICTED: B3 domain-containing protein Os11g0197600-like [Fragaria vesca subsp. vesca]
MADEALRVMMPNPRRPHFFAFFSADLSSDRLKIPERFMIHMEGRTSGVVVLSGPSGNVWNVHLIEQNGDLFFHYGWPAFVRDHSLECGDFLIFRYDGELHFTVQVFDQTACEKEAAFHTRCGQSSSYFEKLVGRKRAREEGCGLDRLFEESTSSQHTKPYENPGLDVVIFKAKQAIQNSLNDRNSMQITPAHEVAQSFSSSNPYFLRIMKNFNISGSYTLNIPYKFSVAHLPNCKVKIVLLNLKGESWTVNSVPTTRVHTSHTLCGGWMAFVRYNDIKLGDICVFELVRECEFRVHIQTGESSSRLCAPITLKGLSKKAKGNSSKVHTKSLRKIEMAETRKHGNTSKSIAKGALSSQSKAASKKLATRRKKTVEDDQGSKAELRMRLSLVEEKAAQSFTSCFPSFVKIMKKFNISGSYTLKIPYQFSTEHLPNFKTEIVLQNSKGESWTVNSVPDSKGRVVHTFCGGWMAFVRGNNINIGDICIFELVGKREMRVHISGADKNGFDHQAGEATTNAV